MKIALLVCSAALLNMALCLAQLPEVKSQAMTAKIASGQKPEFNFKALLEYHRTRVSDFICNNQLAEAKAEQEKLHAVVKEWVVKEPQVAEQIERYENAFKKTLVFVQGLSEAKQQQYVRAFKQIGEARQLLQAKVYREARTEAVQGLQLLRESFGERFDDGDSLEQLNLEELIGTSYLLSGESQKAIPALTNATKISTKIFGKSNHPPIVRAFDLLGMALLDEGRFADAEKHCRDVLDVRRKTKTGIDAPEARLLAMLAKASMGQKRFIEANSLVLFASVLAEGLEQQEEQSITAYCHLLQAEIYLDEARFEQAETYLDAAIEHYEARNGNTSDRLRAYQVQALLFEKTKQADELKKLNLKMAELRKRFSKE